MSEPTPGSIDLLKVSKPVAALAKLPIAPKDGCNGAGTIGICIPEPSMSSMSPPGMNLVVSRYWLLSVLGTLIKELETPGIPKELRS